MGRREDVRGGEGRCGARRRELEVAGAAAGAAAMDSRRRSEAGGGAPAAGGRWVGRMREERPRRWNDSIVRVTGIIFL